MEELGIEKRSSSMISADIGNITAMGKDLVLLSLCSCFDLLICNGTLHFIGTRRYTCQIKRDCVVDHLIAQERTNYQMKDFKI